LGLVDPKGEDTELAKLQLALLAETDEPLLEIALRADRASMQLTFVNLENGKLVKSILAQGGRMEHRSLSEQFGRWVADCYIRRDHAKCLELYSKAVAASRLPYE